MNPKSHDFAVEAAYRFLQDGWSALSVDQVDCLLTNSEVNAIFQETIRPFQPLV